MKNGLRQLLTALERLKLQDQKIEAVRIHDQDEAVDSMPETDKGLFSWQEAVPILERYTLLRSHYDEGEWELPAAMVQVWLENAIVFSHEYDCALSLRMIDRNPS